MFHIQSVHSLYNCPNSFIHYSKCSTTKNRAYGIAGAEYEKDAAELSKTAGWYFEEFEDGSMRFRAQMNYKNCKKPSALTPLFSNPEAALYLTDVPDVGEADFTLWNFGPDLPAEEFEAAPCAS